MRLINGCMNYSHYIHTDSYDILGIFWFTIPRLWGVKLLMTLPDHPSGDSNKPPWQPLRNISRYPIEYACFENPRVEQSAILFWLFNVLVYTEGRENFFAYFHLVLYNSYKHSNSTRPAQSKYIYLSLQKCKRCTIKRPLCTSEYMNCWWVSFIDTSCVALKDMLLYFTQPN